MLNTIRVDIDNAKLNTPTALDVAPVGTSIENKDTKDTVSSRENTFTSLS